MRCPKRRVSTSSRSARSSSRGSRSPRRCTPRARADAAERSACDVSDDALRRALLPYEEHAALAEAAVAEATACPEVSGVVVSPDVPAVAAAAEACLHGRPRVMSARSVLVADGLDRTAVHVDL